MTVEVRLIGHLGNNLFEYALGRVLAEELDRELVVRPARDIFGWNDVERMSGIVDRLHDAFRHFADVPLTRAGTTVERPQIRYVTGERRWGGQGINLPWLLDDGDGHRIVLRGYFQRSEYYAPYKERIRRWYRMPALDLPVVPGSDDVVVHVRRSHDMFVLDHALDLSFYTDLLSGLSFRRVLVCGLGIDERARAALAPFEPTYLDLPAVPTLNLMVRSSRLIIANSTFSWWGAYLSDAREIHFPRPVRGIWSPERPEMNLEVDEPRYRIVDRVPVERWRPFRPVAGSRFALKEHRGGRVLLRVAAPRAGGGTMEIAREFVPVAERIASARGPFGLLDFDDLELPRGTRPDFLRLLAALDRVGAIAADEGTFRAMEGAARGLRGFL